MKQTSYYILSGARGSACVIDRAATCCGVDPIKPPCNAIISVLYSDHEDIRHALMIDLRKYCDIQLIWYWENIASTPVLHLAGLCLHSAIATLRNVLFITNQSGVLFFVFFYPTATGYHVTSLPFCGDVYLAAWGLGIVSNRLSQTPRIGLWSTEEKKWMPLPPRVAFAPMCSWSFLLLYSSLIPIFTINNVNPITSVDHPHTRGPTLPCILYTRRA